jgi:hypothetical protein
MTTYQEYESSAALGNPIELYDIYDSNGTHWRYHTGSINETINYLGNDYFSGIVERSEIILGGEFSDDNTLSLKFTKGDSFANQFISNPIDSIVSLLAYRKQYENYITIYRGSLILVTFDNIGIPDAKFESIMNSTQRMGHRRRCSRLCNHALYQGGCGVNQELFKVTGTVTNIDGNIITSSEFATKADGWFVGGKILIGTAYRLIIAHSTNTVTINRAFVSADIGDSFTAYAGCNHTPSICTSKFNNKLNFGASEYLPLDNPFDKNIEL